MAKAATFTLETIVEKVRALWQKAGAPPSVAAARKEVTGGDADRIEMGISLVGVEYGINCRMLDGMPAEIRALVTDPRGPNGLLPLDPLTRELIPEGVVAGALTMIRGMANARKADQEELERRVGVERERADVVAAACEARVSAALAAQLGAERRYAQQDAEHERDTRELREQLAAAQERIRLLELDSNGELATLTTAVTVTGDAVATMSTRLTSVEEDVGRLRQQSAVSPEKAPSRRGGAGDSRSGRRSLPARGAKSVTGKRAVAARNTPSVASPSRAKRSKVSSGK
jgi:hypothetical protein